MKVLIACEYSGIVREAFRKKGHDAWSCDLLPTEIPGNHFEGDIIPFLYTEHWDLIIAHPPCTYMANSGVRWLWDKDGRRDLSRWGKLTDAMEFFKAFRFEAEKVAIENPIPHKYARYGFSSYPTWPNAKGIGSYTQIVQPYQFGHTTSKATCLWLYGLPKLEPTKIISKEERTFEIHKMAPGPDRQKNRSRTFQGIADAMANQWG